MDNAMIYDLDAWAELGARMGMMLLATRRSIGISERYVNQIRDVKSRKNIGGQLVVVVG